MSRRKHTLLECNPAWSSMDVVDALYFECPEGHADCYHVIPFTPALDGSAMTMDPGRGWQRNGETFTNLTLSPSIARRPKYANREAAITGGCIPEYVTESLLCAIHIFVRDGKIEFCGDSR